MNSCEVETWRPDAGCMRDPPARALGSVPAPFRPIIAGLIESVLVRFDGRNVYEKYLIFSIRLIP